MVLEPGEELTEFAGIPLHIKSPACRVSGSTGALMLTTKSLGWVETVLPQRGSVPITEQGASLGVGVGLGVGVAVAAGVAVGLGGGVGIGGGPDCAQYLPPVLNKVMPSY